MIMSKNDGYDYDDPGVRRSHIQESEVRRKGYEE